ncbi:MAG: hypothetical protein PSN46_03850 [Gammaproteobacteria bacterium]|nr:hypothetical protein [Gammaproteobacteria bacterium]
MIDSYTLVYLLAGLAVVLSCAALPIIGAKFLRKFMAQDAAAAEMTGK